MINVKIVVGVYIYMYLTERHGGVRAFHWS